MRLLYMVFGGFADFGLDDEFGLALVVDLTNVLPRDGSSLALDLDNFNSHSLDFLFLLFFLLDLTVNDLANLSYMFSKSLLQSSFMPMPELSGLIIVDTGREFPCSCLPNPCPGCQPIFCSMLNAFILVPYKFVKLRCQLRLNLSQQFQVSN
uniref:Uncharacterized protein n=1 Tax=Spongospora subterranea TaxID=70186 RepID=A0A0H5RBB6_9EUKA|eukprot:CRZ11101.1 hypothetical protein [Spongospora subterranea]